MYFPCFKLCIFQDMSASNYFNYLCLKYGEEDFSSPTPREFYPASEYCSIELSPIKIVSSLQNICLRHIHQNLALTTYPDSRSTFFDYTPQISVIRNLPLPKIFQARLISLHKKCRIHSSVFEKSDTYITALYFVKGDSNLYKTLENLGEPGKQCINQYFRKKDFLFKLHKAIPYYSEDFSESDRQELFRSVATDLVRSEKLYIK